MHLVVLNRSPIFVSYNLKDSGLGRWRQVYGGLRPVVEVGRNGQPFYSITMEAFGNSLDVFVSNISNKTCCRVMGTYSFDLSFLLL